MIKTQTLSLMCFTVKYITQKKLNYAKRRGDTKDDIAKIEQELNDLTLNMEAQEVASGFTHPALLVFRNVSPIKPELMNWGLVPYWIKDYKRAKQIRNKTLNARGETIFEKPSFKRAAYDQRCIVMVDGFYDYKHLNGKAIPYLIENRDKAPLSFAGLWDNCKTIDGKEWNTVTIVTTKAKGVVKEIHNNPSSGESRSPLILTKELEQFWLDCNNSPIILKDIIEHPLEFDLLATKVGSLGKKPSLDNPSLF